MGRFAPVPAGGLTTTQARDRRPRSVSAGSGPGLWAAVREQFRSPVNGILAGGGCLALTLGQPADAGIIAATIGLNVAVGAWQERRAGRVAESLRRMSTTVARVLRDGEVVTLPASELVTGDVLVLAPGDQVAADARLIEARGLQVDEAALTGESVPVVKAVHGGPAEGHVVRAVQQGTRIQCYLDGKLLLDVADGTLPDAGAIGVWCKADAVSWFDDVSVQSLGKE